MGGADTGSNYTRACELGETLGDSTERFAAYWGDWVHKNDRRTAVRSLSAFGGPRHAKPQARRRWIRATGTPLTLDQFLLSRRCLPSRARIRWRGSASTTGTAIAITSICTADMTQACARSTSGRMPHGRRATPAEALALAESGVSLAEELEHASSLRRRTCFRCRCCIT